MGQIVDEDLNKPEVVLEDDKEEEEPQEEARPGKYHGHVDWQCNSRIYPLSDLDDVLAEPTPKQFTVLLIKPDAVQAGKVDEILEKASYFNKFITIQDNYFNNPPLYQVEVQGYQVLAKEERQLSKEEAAEFYKQHEGSVSKFSHPQRVQWNLLLLQEHFEELVEFMSRYIVVWASLWG